MFRHDLGVIVRNDLSPSARKW